MRRNLRKQRFNDPFALTSGESALARREAVHATCTLTSQSVRLSYFKARKTEAIASLTSCTGGTAAGATPTLCRMGIYQVAADGDLALVASTVNDTALWASQSTAYNKALAETWNKVAGQWYAFAFLCVTGATAPTLIGISAGGPAAYWAAAPPAGMVRTGQTDLPATIGFGDLAGAANQPQGFMLP